MTEQAISPLRRRMIEDMTIRMIVPSTLQATNDLECDTVQWQMRRSSRDTSSRLRSSMTLLRPVHRREPHNSEVVACDIFATPNSLKSHVARSAPAKPRRPAKKDNT